MERLEMLEKARQLAHEEIDGVVSLSDTQHAELQKLPEENAIQQLAQEFLKDTVDWNFGK